jgi:multidrug resistance efflux pump
VESIDVEEGQEVAAGAVLGKLRTQELEVELAEVQARLRGYRAEAMRQEAGGHVAEERAALDLVRYSEAQAAVTKARIEACVLRAPTGGFVLTHRPRDLVGSVAEPGRTLLEVAEKGRWVAEVHIPQADVASLAPGLPASFATTAVPGAIFEGKVSSVGVTAMDSGGTPAFPITCPLEDPGGRLRSGMKGRGHVRLGTRCAARRVGTALLRWVRWQTGF